MYKAGDRYITKKGRTYFFILNPGNPEARFVEAIQTYGLALINTAGGIIVFGVDEKECVRGFDLNRQTEDSYKCSFDRAVRNFRPTIHPHQYRMDVSYLGRHSGFFEIRISAGDAAEIYENARKEMFIVRDKGLYGPLFPCEIAQIVLEKYKEEIATIISKKKPSTKEEAPIISIPTKKQEMILDKEQVKEHEVIVLDDSCVEQKPKRSKISWP